MWEARHESKVHQHHIEVDGKPTHCKHQDNCHQHLEHLLFCFGLADLIGICHFTGNLSGPDLGDDCPVRDCDNDQRDGVKQDVDCDAENPGGVDAKERGPLLGAVAFFVDSHGVDQGGAGHQRRQPSKQDYNSRCVRPGDLPHWQPDRQKPVDGDDDQRQDSAVQGHADHWVNGFTKDSAQYIRGNRTPDRSGNQNIPGSEKGD